MNNQWLLNNKSMIILVEFTWWHLNVENTPALLMWWRHFISVICIVFWNNLNHSKQWMITKGFFWWNKKFLFTRYPLEHLIEPIGTWISQVIDLIFWMNIRAADWNLDQPSWTGRLRLVAKGKDCIIKLEDKTTGEFFAKSPIDN